jgi:hypothetical protein
MAFDESIVEQAWENAGEKCKCMDMGHHKAVPCDDPVIWRKKGKGSRGAWDIYARSADRPFDLDNAVILCYACSRVR